jgi:hypothetical protein
VGAACTALVAALQHHVCHKAHLEGDIGTLGVSDRITFASDNVVRLGPGAREDRRRSA